MNVIGYDFEGKPLIPGDACVLLASDDEEPGLKAGCVVTVSGRCRPGFVYLDYEPVFCDQVAVSYDGLRKLPSDQHKASDQSFGELLSGLKLNQRAVA